MILSDKTPVRLVQMSLFFSAVNFLMAGIHVSSILLFLVFSASVYICSRLFILVERLDMTLTPELPEIRSFLMLGAVLFISIASFAYSWVFGVFYASVFGLYLISPYDRDWIAGKSSMVVHDNKVEYRKSEA
ncbi:MAG: hypothetical protein H7A00_01790 [Hahellaceae bacterium]|nr:hypothetical protein [Hahellaceae bacterium]